jgi:dihydrolipoamide dehydrogenase
LKNKKWLLVLLVALAVGAIFYFDLHKNLSFEAIKSQQQNLQSKFAKNPIGFGFAFFAIYVAATAISLPGAIILTLASGAIFGLWTGLLIASFASSAGATLAFLGARFMLRDWVQARFGQRLSSINRGVEKDGPFYLFTLRLIPVFPFFAVNLLMGLTPIKTLTFYWVSQLGMLAGTLVYVTAGTELGKIESMRGILSPTLIAAFAALGLFPLVARKFIDWLAARKVYAGFTRPSQFDHNVVVIGAGSAGLITALIAAAVKAKVTLVEKHKMGGDCLNTGCVPSKALIKSARLVSQAKQATDYGFDSVEVKFNFASVMQRVHKVIEKIEPHDSVERFTSMGVNCLQGNATIISPWQVQVQTSTGTQTLTTKNIVIATGAMPFVPPIPGIEDTGYLTSDSLWDLRELPGRLLVLGGGPIGCELAQAFARLGSKVTQVEMGARLLAREDPEVSAIVQQSFLEDGIDLRLQHKAVAFKKTDTGQKVLVAEHNGAQSIIEYDVLLCAVGRSARVSGFGLEQLGIGLTPTRTVEVNDRLQTKFPNIYAAGDVAGPFQFTHTAAHMAWYAAVNSLFGQFKSFSVDYRVIPWCTFTAPEVARVGLNEQEAKQKGIAFEVTTYGLDDLDRAIADSVDHGFIKVLTVPGKDKILGVTIVGEHAGDLIAEYVMAMKHGLGLKKILGTIHIYPTLAEANKMVAGNWQKAHQPLGLLRFVEKFHRWQRG